MDAKLAHELATRSTVLVVVESTFLIALNLLSLIGNLLVCFAVYSNCRLRTIPNTFIVALAVSDILVAILSMPFSASILIAGEWLFDESFQFCHFMGFALFQCGISSMLMMSQISLNRYFCVVKPNIYRAIYTHKNTVGIIVSVWMLTLVCSVPPLLMNPGRYSLQPGKALCLYPFESNLAFTLFLDIGFIGTSMNLIAFCSCKVYKTVKASNKRFKTKCSKNQREKNLAANVEEIRVTKTLAAVVFAFASCWLPIGVIDTIDVVNGDTRLPRQVYLLYTFLIYSSSTVNPLIYGIFNRSFRREFRRVLSRRITPESQSDQAGVPCTENSPVAVNSVARMSQTILELKSKFE